MKEEFRSITLEWFNKAESDLDYARASFREFDRFYSQICILCHDAVEKYLKAGLASQGVRPERTHDLVTLLNECVQLAENAKGLIVIEQQCRMLNRYYIPLKYPSHYPTMTKEQAKDAIEAAETIRGEIINALGVAF